VRSDPVPLAEVAVGATTPAAGESGVDRSAQQPETKEERVELTGRLGKTPTFRTTTKGTRVGKFPLAVHLEDGSTTWHTVLAFAARAQKLEQRVTAGELPKGREVDVIGYAHTREQQGKNGKTRIVREIYAAAVKGR
jgi:single-stranded DNA-binding protein